MQSTYQLGLPNFDYLLHANCMMILETKRNLHCSFTFQWQLVYNKPPIRLSCAFVMSKH